MNILISVNKNYLDKAKTMLCSLAKICDEQISVYLMNKELSQRDVNNFEKFLIKKCRIKMVLVDVTHLPFDDMPIIENGHFSIEMYYRILAQEVLPTDLSRILWLDADIIILKDITQFYYQDFQGKCMVVTPDIKFNSSDIIEIKEKINLPKNHKYFNSGVLLLNLDLIRTQIRKDEILTTCNILKNKLTYPDQDILNKVYINQVKYMNNYYYNYQLYEGQEYNVSEISNVAILHYTGIEKPWNYKTVNKFSKFYWSVQLKRKKFISFIMCMFLSKLRKVAISIIYN